MPQNGSGEDPNIKLLEQKLNSCHHIVIHQTQDPKDEKKITNL